MQATARPIADKSPRPQIWAVTKARPNEVPHDKTHVVILGGGYAGLRAALGLADVASVDVTLIDRDAAPVIKTRLHELRKAVPTVDLASLLAGTNVRFIAGEVEAIERRDRAVRLTDGTRVSYDIAIVAIGSRTSDFGIPGVAEHAIRLNHADDGTQLAEAARRVAQKRGRFVVVGAGPTGVEAVGEASAMLPRGRVTLVHADRRILPTFSRLPALYARAVLASRGVRVKNDSEVVHATASHVVLANGESVPYDALLWAAGVEAHPLLAAASLAEPRRPAPVDPFLISKRDPNVYVIGDSADASGSEPSAQVAVQMGDFVAHDISRRLKGKPRKAFEPNMLGQFVSLGCDATGVLKLGPAEVTLFGPPARAAKLAGEARHRLVVGLRTTDLSPSRLSLRS